MSDLNHRKENGKPKERETRIREIRDMIWGEGKESWRSEDRLSYDELSTIVRELRVSDFTDE